MLEFCYFILIIVKSYFAAAGCRMWWFHTPVGKSSMKRSSGDMDSVTNGSGEVGQASVTQPSKMVLVKIEPKD